MMDKHFYRIFLGASLGIICVLLCVISYLIGAAHGRRQVYNSIAQSESSVGGQDEEAEKRSTIASRDTVDAVAESLERKKPAAPQSYEIVMNTEWVFSSEKGIPSENAYVENSRENECAVRFVVALDSSPEDILYRSPRLSPGDKLTDIILEKTLPPGTNKATVTYYMLDENGQETGEVKAGVTLRVES